MPKPPSTPDRIELRLPEGARSRIDRVAGVDPDQRRTGQDIRGSLLRSWIMERLVLEEAAQAHAVSPDLLRRVLALLADSNPDIQSRFIRRIELSENDRSFKKNDSLGGENQKN